MADGYSWSQSRDTGTYRLPGPDHLGWWAVVAMTLSILLHIGVFLLLNHMKIALRFEQAQDLSTSTVNVNQVEVAPMDDAASATPEEVVKPPEDTSSLLEEVDLLAALPKDQPIDIKPEIVEPEFALKMENPLVQGDPAAIAREVSAGLEFDSDLPEFGREPSQIKPAEIGQLTVDPGAAQADDDKLGKYTDDLIKRGANGKAQKGALDGVASLDDLLDLPPNVLLSKKTMLPSDLLFEFNRAELRDSAKVGLMKIGLLMDRNPGMHCWVEGHTDLVGGDEFNLNLSIRRAEAVKDYLVKSMRMDASRIHTRGFGRYEPIVTSGNNEEQAANRRVEIRMRNTPPAADQMKVEPQKATVIPEAPPPTAKPVVETPPPPKAVLVKPKRALPVEEDTVPPAPSNLPPLKAQPVEDPARPAPKAKPVEEPPLRAEPVVE